MLIVVVRPLHFGGWLVPQQQMARAPAVTVFWSIWDSGWSPLMQLILLLALLQGPLLFLCPHNSCLPSWESDGQCCSIFSSHCRNRASLQPGSSCHSSSQHWNLASSWRGPRFLGSGLHPHLSSTSQILISAIPQSAICPFYGAFNLTLFHWWKLYLVLLQTGQFWKLFFASAYFPSPFHSLNM